jgi:hypothetical protein
MPTITPPGEKFAGTGSSSGGGGGDDGGLSDFLQSLLEGSGMDPEIRDAQLASLRSQVQLSDLSFQMLKDSQAQQKAQRAAFITQFGGKTPEEIQALEGKQAFDINQLQGARLLAALKGELPVDPALERELGRQESLQRESVVRDLGPTGQNSSAGIERLARQQEVSDIARNAARQGELGTGASQVAASTGVLAGLFPQTTSVQNSFGDALNALQGVTSSTNALAGQAQAQRALSANIGLGILGINSQRDATQAQIDANKFAFNNPNPIPDLNTGPSSGSQAASAAASAAGLAIAIGIAAGF